jgi:hypothetical protein
VPARTPLSTLLSQVVVAFTIELDNEFERRFVAAGGGARITSLVMWSNLLRFVGDGIAAGEIATAAGLQRPRVFSTLGGVERWRYVYVTPTPKHRLPKEKRDGYGSARGLKADSFVRLTPAGERAAAIWPELLGEIEMRWRDRFGAASVAELESILRRLVEAADLDLPEYLPIVGASNGMALDLPTGERRRPSGDPSLVALLAQVLLAYTIEFEERSTLSLPIAANVIRVLGESEVLVRDLPGKSGISNEAVAMTLTSLGETGLVQVEGTTVATKAIRLTPAGLECQGDQPRVHAGIEQEWQQRFGTVEIDGLRAALGHVLGHADLASGLRTPPGGWRASKPYAARTDALLTDPPAALPQYPMVLHRGGWPDGS